MIVRDSTRVAVPPDLAARATVLGFAALGIGVAAALLFAGNGHDRGSYVRSQRPRPTAEVAMSAGLEGRVAIVTGGSRGIGAACARGLAKAGARVVISYSRSHEQATAVVDSIMADGGHARALVADQADPRQAAELVWQVAKELGGSGGDRR